MLVPGFHVPGFGFCVHSQNVEPRNPGTRNLVVEVRDYLAAAYGPIAVEDVADYLRLLEKVGVVRME